MSEINEPKQVISDEDKGQIAPELVEKYDFETELDEEELTRFDQEELAIVNNYDNWIDMSQLQNDYTASKNSSNYKPAQVIRVISKTARTLSSGQVVLDYELEVESVEGAYSYEVRVLQQ